MNPVAVVALGAAALVLHVVGLVLCTPLLLAGQPVRLPPAGNSGRWGAALIVPFRDLAALAAKEPVRSDGASAVSVAAPVLALALTGAASLLVPSFATGMLDWPLSDLPLVLALLAGARLAGVVAAADGGAAAHGLAAVGATVDALLALPGLVLATVMLFLLSGSTVLDAMLAGHRGLASAAGLACAASLAMAALAGGGRDVALSRTLSGPDLALWRIEGAMRRLVWIDLVGALAWPGSLTPAQSGPLPWLLALILWLLRVALGAIVLAALADAVRPTRGRRGLAALSLLAACLAPVLLLAGRGTA